MPFCQPKMCESCDGSGFAPNFFDFSSTACRRCGGTGTIDYMPLDKEIDNVD